MGRIKGSKNKKRLEIEEMRSDESFQEATATLTVTKPFDVVLGVRHLGKDSKFPNLWSLSIVNQDGSETMLMDATSKASIINIARNEILRCL